MAQTHFNLISVEIGRRESSNQAQSSSRKLLAGTSKPKLAFKSNSSVEIPIKFAERILDVLEIKLELKLQNVKELISENLTNFAKAQKDFKRVKQSFSDLRPSALLSNTIIEDDDSRFYYKMVKRSNRGSRAQRSRSRKKVQFANIQIAQKTEKFYSKSKARTDGNKPVIESQPQVTSDRRRKRHYYKLENYSPSLARKPSSKPTQDPRGDRQTQEAPRRLNELPENPRVLIAVNKIQKVDKSRIVMSKDGYVLKGEDGKVVRLTRVPKERFVQIKKAEKPIKFLNKKEPLIVESRRSSAANKNHQSRRSQQDSQRLNTTHQSSPANREQENDFHDEFEVLTPSKRLRSVKIDDEDENSEYQESPEAIAERAKEKARRRRKRAKKVDRLTSRRSSSSEDEESAREYTISPIKKKRRRLKKTSKNAKKKKKVKKKGAGQKRRSKGYNKLDIINQLNNLDNPKMESKFDVNSSWNYVNTGSQAQLDPNRQAFTSRDAHHRRSKLTKTKPPRKAKKKQNGEKVKKRTKKRYPKPPRTLERSLDRSRFQRTEKVSNQQKITDFLDRNSERVQRRKERIEQSEELLNRRRMETLSPTPKADKKLIKLERGFKLGVAKTSRRQTTCSKLVSLERLSRSTLSHASKRSFSKKKTKKRKKHEVSVNEFIKDSETLNTSRRRARILPKAPKKTKGLKKSKKVAKSKKRSNGFVQPAAPPESTISNQSLNRSINRLRNKTPSKKSWSKNTLKIGLKYDQEKGKFLNDLVSEDIETERGAPIAPENSVESSENHRRLGLDNKRSYSLQTKNGYQVSKRSLKKRLSSTKPRERRLKQSINHKPRSVIYGSEKSPDRPKTERGRSPWYFKQKHSKKGSIRQLTPTSKSKNKRRSGKGRDFSSRKLALSQSMMDPQAESLRDIHNNGSIDKTFTSSVASHPHTESIQSSHKAATEEFVSCKSDVSRSMSAKVSRKKPNLGKTFHRKQGVFSGDGKAKTRSVEREEVASNTKRGESTSGGVLRGRRSKTPTGSGRHLERAINPKKSPTRQKRPSKQQHAAQKPKKKNKKERKGSVAKQVKKKKKKHKKSKQRSGNAKRSPKRRERQGEDRDTDLSESPNSPNGDKIKLIEETGSPSDTNPDSSGYVRSGSGPEHPASPSTTIGGSNLNEDENIENDSSQEGRQGQSVSPYNSGNKHAASKNANTDYMAASSNSKRASSRKSRRLCLEAVKEVEDEDKHSEEDTPSKKSKKELEAKKNQNEQNSKKKEKSDAKELKKSRKRTAVVPLDANSVIDTAGLMPEPIGATMCIIEKMPEKTRHSNKSTVKRKPPEPAKMEKYGNIAPIKTPEKVDFLDTLDLHKPPIEDLEALINRASLSQIPREGSKESKDPISKMSKMSSFMVTTPGSSDSGDTSGSNETTGESEFTESDSNDDSEDEDENVSFDPNNMPTRRGTLKGSQASLLSRQGTMSSLVGSTSKRGSVRSNKKRSKMLFATLKAFQGIVKSRYSEKKAK